jgi:ATP-dependent DNA helicase RecQ
MKRIADTFPEKDYIRKVYDHLAYFYQVGVGSGYNAVFEFPIDKFCKTYGHFPVRVEAALKILNRAGYIDYKEEEESKARLMFLLERDDLYRLKGNTPDEDALIVALLRNYSGLFNEYHYIEEALLAQQTSLTQQQVYMTLKALKEKHILSFIPQKKTPYICYLQRREDSEHLSFPPDIYDDLKKRYIDRIEAMIHYADASGQCRSGMLLRYFGEDKTEDCGHCDVCIDRKAELTAKTAVNNACQQIMEILSDGKPHHIGELHTIPLPYPSVEEALHRLVAEAVIVDDDGKLYQNH